MLVRTELLRTRSARGPLRALSILGLVVVGITSDACDSTTDPEKTAEPNRRVVEGGLGSRVLGNISYLHVSTVSVPLPGNAAKTDTAVTSGVPLFSRNTLIRVTASGSISVAQSPWNVCQYTGDVACVGPTSVGPGGWYHAGLNPSCRSGLFLSYNFSGTRWIGCGVN